jgi:hypothetical protein
MSSNPKPRIRRHVRISVLAIFALALALVPTPSLASDTATRWDTFSESTGCGAPFTRSPLVSRIGLLSDSEPVMGPFGTYFGRSIGEVRGKLRTWMVPNSGGLLVHVHEAMLPALSEVAAGLAAHAQQGRVYNVTSAFGFAPRTIGGRYHLSRHAMGLAIDLNPVQNPHRLDGVLQTNMPFWFVQTWRDAGFCWGGDWVGSAKDPMHFAWMGPAATPSSPSLNPLPPKTTKTSFRGPVATHGTEFGPVTSRYALSVADGNGNGAPDVMGLRSHPNGAVIDMTRGSFGFGRCSVARWFVPDRSVASADHVLFADVNGDSGQDLIALTGGSGSLRATIANRHSGFEDLSTTSTGASTEAVAVFGADFDGDHRADLWEATPDGRLRIWTGPGFTQLLDESDLPSGAPRLIAAGDRDGGNTPELYALYREGNRARIDVLTHTGSWTVETSIDIGVDADWIEAIGAGDYDGDGRADAQVLTDTGDLIVYLGNSSTGVPASRWFLEPNRDCNDPVLLDYNGSFMDDDENIFEQNIESIAAAGVTRGCNPPFNDRFCPNQNVTREQMAAFLVRALDLTESTHGGFRDVPAGSTFAQDIGRLATAGITRGCNPPANDRFCPKDNVSREQMAAFMVRALELADATHPGFTDVPSRSTFANDIRRLASEGITRGCNPPVNDRYCPKGQVTRGQMAAFLDRAGLGDR